MSIIISLLVLSLLIFLHELGHFSAARFLGVKVEVFSIGFGTKLLSKKIGDTVWSISAIPLGGYVKMKGQDDTDPTKKSFDADSYTAKKPWERIIILLAGPMANFLTAFILYTAVAAIGIPKLLPEIGNVDKNTPAYSAGIQKNDKIIQINGTKILYWEEISQAIEHSPQRIEMTLLRGNQYVDLILIPKIIEDQNLFGEIIQRPIIGITPLGTQMTVAYNFTDALDYGVKETLKASTLIIQSVEKLITGVVGTDKLGGVISIVDITAQASSAGIVALFFFTALISVNLGVLNLLPIPALDGGHILFNLYEWIRRKSPSEAVMYYMTVTGWGLLISLMLVGLYNDINRLWMG